MPSKIYKCPLCESTEMDILDVVHVSHLVVGYASLGLDVRAQADKFGKKTIDFLRCNYCGLRYFYPIFSADDKLYCNLQKFEWYYLDEKYEYRVAQTNISDDMSVLEVGCGSGAFYEILGKPRGYLGLEYNADAIEKAQSRGATVSPTSIEDLASKRGCLYDVVCSFQVLEHVENPRSFIKGCVDLLELGGLLIFAVPSDDSHVGYAPNALLNVPPHHLTRWSDRAIASIQNIVSVELVSISHEPVQDIHVQWFSIIAAYRRLFTRIPTYNLSVVNRIKSLMAKVLSNITPLRFSLGKEAQGHTVVAIFRKI